MKFLVTEEQRDRALAFLQDAFARGRIDETEFEDRMGQALAANTRKELNAAFRGLVHIPISSGSVSPTRQNRGPNSGFGAGEGAGSNIAAGLLHWSQLIGYVIPPVVAFGVADKGSRTRREAAQAILFSLLSGLGVLAGYLLLPGLIFRIVAGLVGIVWALGVVIAGARALKGETAYPFLPGAAKKRPPQKKPLDWRD